MERLPAIVSNASVVTPKVVRHTIYCDHEIARWKQWKVTATAIAGHHWWEAVGRASSAIYVVPAPI